MHPWPHELCRRATAYLKECEKAYYEGIVLPHGLAGGLVFHLLPHNVLLKAPMCITAFKVYRPRPPYKDADGHLHLICKSSGNTRVVAVPPVAGARILLGNLLVGSLQAIEMPQIA
jgi:hypothetical protein